MLWTTQDMNVLKQLFGGTTIIFQTPNIQYTDFYQTKRTSQRKMKFDRNKYM